MSLSPPPDERTGGRGLPNRCVSDMWCLVSGVWYLVSRIAYLVSYRCVFLICCCTGARQHRCHPRGSGLGDVQRPLWLLRPAWPGLRIKLPSGSPPSLPPEPAMPQAPSGFPAHEPQCPGWWESPLLVRISHGEGICQGSHTRAQEREFEKVTEDPNH